MLSGSSPYVFRLKGGIGPRRLHGLDLGLVSLSEASKMHLAEEWMAANDCGVMDRATHYFVVGSGQVRRRFRYHSGNWMPKLWLTHGTCSAWKWTTVMVWRLWMAFRIAHGWMKVAAVAFGLNYGYLRNPVQIKYGYGNPADGAV